MTLGQGLRNQRTGIEDQVGLLKHPAATHRNQVGVAGTGTHNFDVRRANTEHWLHTSMVNGEW